MAPTVYSYLEEFGIGNQASREAREVWRKGRHGRNRGRARGLVAQALFAGPGFLRRAEPLDSSGRRKRGPQNDSNFLFDRNVHFGRNHDYCHSESERRLFSPGPP
jgi:hypothetical protein